VEENMTAEFEFGENGKTRCYKWTLKTKVCMWFHDRFSSLAYWFLKHVDTEECDLFQITQTLIEDSQFKIMEKEK